MNRFRQKLTFGPKNKDFPRFGHNKTFLLKSIKVTFTLFYMHVFSITSEKGNKQI